MKKILATAAALMTATTVAAGNIAYVAPDPVIVEPTRMGGSGAWIIPLIVLAGIILAVTSSDNEEEREG